MRKLVNILFVCENIIVFHFLCKRTDHLPKSVSLNIKYANKITMKSKFKMNIWPDKVNPMIFLMNKNLLDFILREFYEDHLAYTIASPSWVVGRQELKRLQISQEIQNWDCMHSLVSFLTLFLQSLWGKKSPAGTQFTFYFPPKLLYYNHC